MATDRHASRPRLPARAGAAILPHGVEPDRDPGPDHRHPGRRVAVLPLLRRRQDIRHRRLPRPDDRDQPDPGRGVPRHPRHDLSARAIRLPGRPRRGAALRVGRPRSYGFLVARVERYGPGEEAPRYEPGDFLLTHRNRPIGALISLGQKRRFRGPDSVYAHWSHCALVADGDGGIVEAEALGVVKSHISKYRATEYHLVRLAPSSMPKAATALSTTPMRRSASHLDTSPSPACRS